jgi:hypothetical protein
MNQIERIRQAFEQCLKAGTFTEDAQGTTEFRLLKLAITGIADVDPPTPRPRHMPYSKTLIIGGSLEDHVKKFHR